MQKKKGISLIVLVITIIVMIILAAAIILSLNNAGIIGNANQAVFKQNIKNYLSELDLYYMDALIDNSYANTKNIKATATTNPSITDLIPSMSEEDKTKFRVAGGNLIYIGANRSEYEWCRELGIIIDSTNLSDEEYTNLYKKEIAYFRSITSDTIEEGYDGGEGCIKNYSSELNTDTIVVPYGIKHLGIEAFVEETILKNIIFPKTLETIGSNAFVGCTSLNNVIIPKAARNISDCAFADCTNLSNVEFQEGLHSIGYKSFYGCTSLNNLVFPEGLYAIAAEAFGKCSGLTSVIIPSTVGSINSPFTACENLKEIYVAEGNNKFSSVDGVLYNKNQTVLINVTAEKKGTFVVPEGVITIERNAFTGCTKLTKIVLPDSLQTLSNYIFDDCTSLQSITIPKNVTKIHGGLFNGCTNLKNVYIESTAFANASDMGSWSFKGLPEGSTIYVRNSTIASYLNGDYDTTKTTISTDYNW